MSLSNEGVRRRPVSEGRPGDSPSESDSPGREQEAEERGALSRRIVLYVILFAAVITILFNGAFVLNSLLRLLLGEPATGRLLSGLFASVGNVAVVGLFLFYHWRVLQRDQQLTATLPLAHTKAVTVLAAQRFHARIKQLESALGSPVTLLEALPSDAIADADQSVLAWSSQEVEALLERIGSTPGESVFLLFAPSGVEVYPFRRTAGGDAGWSSAATVASVLGAVVLLIIVLLLFGPFLFRI